MLTADNRLQWARLAELVGVGMALGDGSSGVGFGDGGDGGDGGADECAAAAAGRGDGGAPSSAASLRDAAGSGTTSPLATASALLGSPDGASLRRIARDVDSTDLLLQLTTSPDTRPLREMSTATLAAAIQRKLRLRPLLRRGVASREAARIAAEWPASTTSLALQRRRTRRSNQILSWLTEFHLKGQLAAGARGYVAVLALMWLTVRVGVMALALATLRSTLGGATFVGLVGTGLVRIGHRAGLLATPRLHRTALCGVYALTLLVLLWRSKCNGESCKAP